MKQEIKGKLKEYAEEVAEILSDPKRNKGTQAVVGKIYFYPPWKQFVFEPRELSVFSDGCLEDIIWRMKFLNKK